MTSESDRAALLRIAREAVVAHVLGGAPPEVNLDGPLAEVGCAFVTLHHHGELRGCIGHLQHDLPLGRVVAQCAVAACSSDPRFLAVTAAELPGIDIELSILGPLEPAKGPDEIEIGRHGLVAERGWQRGLLLPQVAAEWRWDGRTFIEQTCHKAGLPRDAWRHDATLWKFEAEVFRE